MPYTRDIQKCPLCRKDMISFILEYECNNAECFLFGNIISELSLNKLRNQIDKLLNDY